MTPADSVAPLPAPQGRRKSSGRLRQILWVSVPVWSLGILSFVPFLAFAAIHRRARYWAVFAAYLAATIAVIVAIGAVKPNSGAQEAVGGFTIALAGCAAIHSARLFRPVRSQEAVAEPKYALMRKTIHYSVYVFIYLAWTCFVIWFFLNSPMRISNAAHTTIGPTPACAGCPGDVPILVTFMAASGSIALGFQPFVMPIHLFLGDFKMFRMSLVGSIASVVVYAGAFALRNYVGWKNV